MMVVHMHYIRPVLPFRHPVQRSNLKTDKPFGIIVIAIYLLAIQQSIDIYQVQIETQFIGELFYNGIVEPPVPEISTALMHHFPLVVIEELSAVHRHDHFGNMALLYLILRQGSQNVSQPSGFSHRVTFSSNVDDFHDRGLVQLKIMMFFRFGCGDK